MEKVIHYRQLMKQFMRGLYQEYFSFSKESPIEKMLIEDDEKGQYLIFSEGWKDIRRYYGCSVHIHVRDNGHIWLHHDGTDLEIGEMLLNLDIPKSDIVLGFHAPDMRADTEFAVT